MEPLQIGQSAQQRSGNLMTGPGSNVKVSIADDPLCKPQVTQQDPAVSCSTNQNLSTNNTHVDVVMSGDDHSDIDQSRILDNKQATCFGKTLSQWTWLVTSCVMVVVGMPSGVLLGRLYFMQGGSRRWLSTWAQSAGWPINLVPLLIAYCWFSVRPTPLTPKLALIYTAMGCLTALDNLLYAWGLSYLPASTSSLLCSTQLVFNALFAYLLLGHKVTPYVLNSVVVLTMGAILLGIYAENDRPAGTTKGHYIVGFVMTVTAAALYGLILALTELMYRKVLGRSSFVVVVEAQTAISVVATLISMVGMSGAGDYAALSGESSQFKLGAHMYALTLLGCAVGWQLLIVGSAGLIFLTSALMSCAFLTATLPLVPILAVVFFHDNFSALKAMAMLLSIWGFISYIYGGYVAASQSQSSYNTVTPRPARLEKSTSSRVRAGSAPRICNSNPFGTKILHLAKPVS